MMLAPKPNEKCRYLSPDREWRQNIAHAASIVDGEARHHGMFREIHPGDEPEYDGRPPNAFLEALEKADVMWFADEDVQIILQHKIADLKTREESKVIGVALKALYAINVEFGVTYKMRTPYNEGGSDREGWSNLRRINKGRIEVGKIYRIFRFERLKSSTICFDDDYFVIAPDGTPGICKPYRVLATAALCDHWEGTIVESRQVRGMDGVASDEKENFLPVLREGAQYDNLPGNSKNPIFMTGDLGDCQNGILDLRSKDFLYNEWVAPVDAKLTTESFIRFFNLKKMNNHEGILANQAIEKTKVAKNAAKKIIDMGFPGSGTRYDIVGDQVLLADVPQANSGRHRAPVDNDEPKQDRAVVQNSTSRSQPADSHDGPPPLSSSENRQEERQIPRNNQAALQWPLNTHPVIGKEDADARSRHIDCHSQLDQRLENGNHPQQYGRLDRRDGNVYQTEQGTRRDRREQNGHQPGRGTRLERREENWYQSGQTQQFDRRLEASYQHVPGIARDRSDHYRPNQRGQTESGRSRADEPLFSAQGSNAIEPTEPPVHLRRRRRTADLYSETDRQTYSDQGTRRRPDTPHNGDTYRPPKRHKRD